MILPSATLKTFTLHLSQWLLQVLSVGLRLCVCVSKVLDRESKWRSLNLCCLWLAEGRKELLSGHPESNLRIKTSLLLLLVRNIQNPTVISHQGRFPFDSWCVSDSVKVSLCGSWSSCQTRCAQFRCFFCVFPIPQTALASKAECPRPWLELIIPWFAKLSSWFESHLSINKLLAIIKVRIGTESKI